MSSATVKRGWATGTAGLADLVGIVGIQGSDNPNVQFVWSPVSIKVLLPSSLSRRKKMIQILLLAKASIYNDTFGEELLQEENRGTVSISTIVLPIKLIWTYQFVQCEL